MSLDPVCGRRQAASTETIRSSSSCHLFTWDISNAALAGLYRAHASELHGFARRRVRRQEAEDVVRDAYLHLVQRGTAATLEQPRAYLFRTAANLAVDFARKAKSVQQSPSRARIRIRGTSW